LDEKNEKTILVADDEESIREIVKHHLKNQGYNVITSENGEDAIKVLKKNEISLAITDLKMPKVDGYGVIDYIKTHCSYVPVIVLTGYIDIETAVSSMKKGAVDYIPKPIKRDDFINVVKSALKKKNLKKDLNPFEILGLYLLDEGGVVIFHKDITFHSQFDSDMFGSMLTAVKTFMKDSFRSKDELRFIEHGSLKILIEKGKKFFIVVVGKGGVIDPIKEKMKKIVEKINEKYGKIISNWSGNIDIFEGIEKEFEILIPQFGLEKKSSN